MFEKLCKLIADQFGVEPDSVKADTAFVDDLGADSVDLVDLSMALEEEFGMEEMGGRGDRGHRHRGRLVQVYAGSSGSHETGKDREKVPLRRGFFCDWDREDAMDRLEKSWATTFRTGGCWSTP